MNEEVMAERLSNTKYRFNHEHDVWEYLYILGGAGRAATWLESNVLDVDEETGRRIIGKSPVASCVDMGGEAV